MIENRDSCHTAWRRDHREGRRHTRALGVTTQSSTQSCFTASQPSKVGAGEEVNYSVLSVLVARFAPRLSVQLSLIALIFENLIRLNISALIRSCVK